MKALLWIVFAIGAIFVVHRGYLDRPPVYCEPKEVSHISKVIHRSAVIHATDGTVGLFHQAQISVGDSVCFDYAARRYKEHFAPAK